MDDSFLYILSILKDTNMDILKNPQYYDRMKKEILEIKRLGQVENIKNAIEIKNIIETFRLPFFIIRGSAGGSLVLFLLGFTDIDPIKHNIVFERFINEFRTTLGDIDFDLPRSKRDSIMKKVFLTTTKKMLELAELLLELIIE